jgi:GntR family transcriptional regulator, transcriptional repressor for pyruvate dehydrogenase complex
MKKFEESLRHLSKIEVAKASDIIMNQIRRMLEDGALKPGVRLPPERVMAEQFGVGRSQVREAITKLVSLRVLKTLPQSGTYVEDSTKGSVFATLKRVSESGGNEKDDLVNLWVLLSQADFKKPLEREEELALEALSAKVARKAAKGSLSFVEEGEVSGYLSRLRKNGIARRLLASMNPPVHQILEEGNALPKATQVELCACLRELVKDLKQNDNGKALVRMSQYNNLLTNMRDEKGREG